jgi:hypothetical protein
LNTALLTVVNTGLVLLVTYPGTLFTAEWYVKAGGSLTTVYVIAFI